MEDEPVVDLSEVAVVPNAKVKMETITGESTSHMHVEVEGANPVIQNDPPMILQDEEFLFTSDGRYVCDICGDVCSIRSTAEQHMMAHYEKMIAEEGEQTSANDITMSENSVEPVKDEPMKFELIVVKSECDDALQPNEVHNAVSTISVETPIERQYNCDICGLTLSDRNSIRDHVGSHFETKPYECYICTYNTNEKYRIVRHMIAHFGWDLGMERYTCNLCSFETKVKSHFSRHMLIHSEIKPFVCDVCGYKANRKDSLQKHMNTHKAKTASGTDLEAESDSHSSRHTSGSTSSLDHPLYSATSSTEETDSAIKMEPNAAVPNVGMVAAAAETSKELANGLGTIEENAAPLQLVVMINNSDVPANQTVHIALKEVQREAPTDQVQLNTSQDWAADMFRVEGNIITCSICSYSTHKKYKYKLKEHMNIHTGERPFACDLCDSKFARKRNLDRHRLSHSGELPYLCKWCDYAAKHKSLLTKHMKVHLGQETSNGQTDSNEGHSLNDPLLAGFSVDSQSTTGDDVVMIDPHQPSVDPLQLRLNEEHSQDSGLSSSSGPKTISSCNKRFKCEVCSYKSDRKYEFDVHLRTHTGETPFACDLCDKRYISRKTLNRHKKTHLRDKRCGLCGFCASQDAELAIHMKIHQTGTVIKTELSDDEPKDPLQLELREDSGPSSSYEATNKFTCDVCGFETSQKANFESHLMTHTGEKLFACDFCGKSYTARKTLDRHIRSCHGEKLFGCTLCDFKSVKKSDLNDHLETHCETSEMNEVGIGTPAADEHFTCVHCDYECDDITEWSEHMFKHTNEKIYSCDQCEFKTKYESSMGVHKAVHAEKSVKVTCEFCDHPFTTKANMNDHLMTRHPELYSSCDVCDFKALDKRSLELHKATHSNLFKCNICDYKVDKEVLLSRHIATAHAVVEEYACYSCDYKASNIKDVEQHILTTHSAAEPPSSMTVVAETPNGAFVPHTDPKPYKCSICDFKSSKIAQVEQHILDTHAVLVENVPAAATAPSLSTLEVYSCYACDFEASDVAQVEQHIFNTHNPATSETTASPMDVTSEAPSSITSL